MQVSGKAVWRGESTQGLGVRPALHLVFCLLQLQGDPWVGYLASLSLRVLICKMGWLQGLEIMT